MKRIKYINGTAVTPWECLPHACVLVEDGTVVSVSSDAHAAQIQADETVDLEGDYLAPGFIDIHIHGGGGGDFMDGTEKSFLTAMKTHLKHGTTALCPTTLTATFEELGEVFAQSRRMRERAQKPEEGLPSLLGVHMEGPYIAPVMKGAQDEAYIHTPSDGSYKEILQMADGELRIWTCAPELAGASELAAYARQHGVLLSVGHSDARIEDVEQAILDGYTMATHLYSSMSTIIRENGVRRPGVLEAAMLYDALDAEIIADGMHLPPSLLKLTVKTKGFDHVILVTDAMRAAGMKPGIYRLGSLRRGQEVISDGTIARLQDGISFAGSVATADRLVRVMTKKADIPLWQAVRMVTYNPARALGETMLGGLVPGRYADLIRFNADIQIQEVYRRGILAWSRQEDAE